MDNGTEVVTTAGKVRTITTPAGRVTDPSARTIGNSGGEQEHTLDINNLPPHQHKLSGDQGTQFYAVNNVQGDTPTDGGSSNTYGTQGVGERLDRTGDVLYGPPSAQPISVMNPYMSINYLIYAGKVYTI